jgi:hypothetical protein
MQFKSVMLPLIILAGGFNNVYTLPAAVSTFDQRDVALSRRPECNWCDLWLLIQLHSTQLEFHFVVASSRNGHAHSGARCLKKGNASVTVLGVLLPS